MEYYLLGVLVAFLINVVRLFFTIITRFSQRVRNIEKLGTHYNIIEGECTKEKPTAIKLAFFLVDLLLITPLLSWLYVGYFVFAIIKARVNRVPVPEKIKEIRFKLSSVSLPKETVKECMKEIASFYGTEYDDRIPYDDEYDKNDYIITSGSGMHDWNVNLELDKKNRTFVINARDPDFGEHIDTYEYKLEGFDLWCRTIESKHKYPDHIEYDIKNGVVLEQDYRERHEESRFNTAKEIEEQIKKLYSEINWEKNTNATFRYFIMFRHGDLFDDMTIRRFLQSEYERITSGFKRLEERVNKLGGSLNKEEFMGQCIRCAKGDISKESIDEINEILYGDGIARYNITHSEFSYYDKIIEDLELYLSKL